MSKKQITSLNFNEKPKLVSESLWNEMNKYALTSYKEFKESDKRAKVLFEKDKLNYSSEYKSSSETNEKQKIREENKLEESLKSKRLKQLVRDLGERSSIHGLSSLSNAYVNKFVKLIWLGFCLASWSLFAFQIYNIVSFYNMYSVISSVSVGYEAPTIFPGIKSF